MLKNLLLNNSWSSGVFISIFEEKSLVLNLIMELVFFVITSLIPKFSSLIFDKSPTKEFENIIGWPPWPLLKGMDILSFNGLDKWKFTTSLIKSIDLGWSTAISKTSLSLFTVDEIPFLIEVVLPFE